MNLAFELFLELDYALFSALEVCGLDPNFVLQGGDLGDCFVKCLFALLLLEFPFLGKLINFFDFLLF